MHLMELIDKNTITVIDLETSGLDCMRDYIIDVGGVKIGGWNKVKGKDGQALIDKGKNDDENVNVDTCANDITPEESEDGGIPF